MKLLLGVLVAVLAVASAARCPKPVTVHYTGLYLSLGDSIADGSGASAKTATSFVALLAHDEGNPVLNIAVAGETTSDVIDKQLPEMALRVGTSDLAFITISVGGNDLAALIPNPACRDEPLPPSCPLDDALRHVEANLDTIMRRLRDAHPRTPIVLLAYPNFFSGTGHPFEAPAARVLPRLDDLIRTVAARYPHTAVADAAPAFEGHGAELTHVLDPRFDPHPNDAGHREIANAFIDALNHVR